MKQVSKYEFFAFIGPKDTVLETTGSFSYPTFFKMRNTHKIIGKIIDHKFDDESEYFIEELENNISE